MSYSPGKRSAQEGRPFASVSPVGSTGVEESVYAPEGHHATRQGSTSESPRPALPVVTIEGSDSSLWQRLFPADSDPSAPPDPALAAGCVLGHFSIEERIGSGGMGAVFRAVDMPLQRVVALKVLSPAHSRDRAAVLRFQNEARAAARLDHDHVARVFYIGQSEGLHFIAFEYITGQNIRDLIARTGPLSVADAVNYTLQITSALRHVAAAGVVHRDIKPSNIIITPGGRAELVDLGLARKLAAEDAGELTIAGTTLGTFDYISPEQARDPRAVDVRSDIYSLGCTLYHMLTGVPPYASGTVAQKLLDHQAGHVPDPRAVNPKIPAALTSICHKMMAGDPRNRYANPDELLRDLAGLAAKIGLRPAPPDAYVWKRPSVATVSRIRPGFIWFGSALVVLLLAVVVDLWPFWQAGGELPNSQRQPPAIHNPDLRRDARATERRRFPVNRPLGDGGDTAGGSMASSGVDMSGSAGVAPGQLAREMGLEPSGGLPPELSLAGGALPTKSTGSGPVYAPVPHPTLQSPLHPGLAKNSSAPRVPLPSQEVPARPDGQADSQETRTVETGRPSLDGVIATISWMQSLLDSRIDSPAGQVAPHQNVTSAASRHQVAPFIVRSADGSESLGADSLTEAIGLAEDGQTIILQFDGPLPGGPISQTIRIEDKQITLAAGHDGPGETYRPIIEFRNDPAKASPARMFVLSGNSPGLTLEGLHLRMTITDAIQPSEAAVLFLVVGPGRVRLRETAIRIDGRRWACSVFELHPDESGMDLMSSGPDERSEIVLSDSFLHGSADLVTIAHSRGARIEISNSGIVLRKSLVNITGGLETPEMGAHVDLTLNHVTAVLENQLVCVFLSGIRRYQAPIHVTAKNSVLATFEDGQLIFMNGTDSTIFNDSLVWEGERNLFFGISEFWSVSRPADGAGLVFPESFQDWQQYWQSQSDGSSLNELAIAAGDEMVQLWADRTITRLEPLEFTPTDLRLNRYAMNIKVKATDDSSLVGVDPETLPEPMTEPGTTLNAPDALGQPSEAPLMDEISSMEP